MEKQFDTIIWGPSLNGIIQAVEQKESGRQVLLAGKFGFPGGKATEALASFYPLEYFKEHPLLEKFLLEAEKLRHGILFRNQQWVLIHPETVKRICWQMIGDYNLEIMFHILPLRIYKGTDAELEVFGREGKFTLQANEVIDLSDDRYLNRLNGESAVFTMCINAFFTEALPAELPGFRVARQFNTSLGQYLSVSLKNVEVKNMEKTFNYELDRLSKESWSKYGSRILMVPVYPELSTNFY
jgi:hypothetical protein